ncbi:DsbE family thiol:disulfide interchange protein [Psychrobium sp. 1_MG-2023]|uniref:DsbE family thiol:disulfide interchange protein n=1 Tax=Psychrobium sp. 1_MG-2023 TaxID=3062624 RepID=UPI000C324BAE|nr:DsbE family thiol:disulfide interchange protein [Psychrobium sp. 1_MG-2023]MDP2562638.1 DsbE family thiol:disulfide interchange protein [Psychrobium sp. 1_MG-2023]PKF54393.1 DsbE family thiol:disulfide interchange protein [Alteromonadales bacterium alter-6D02]
MKRAILFFPLILFIVIGGFLYKGLFLNPQAMPSALEGQPVPEFKLLTVNNPERVVTNKDLTGEVYLLNVWATWCAGCKIEHPHLINIANTGLPIYGINYKDELEAAQQWLKDYQDPYQFTAYDVSGQLGLDLGVFGAPETFVVDHHGIIRLRYAGTIDENIWLNKIKPLVDTIKQEAALVVKS